jgi:hypothetical protein
MLRTVTIPRVGWLEHLISSARTAESACALPSAIGRNLTAEFAASTITTALETRRMLAALIH